MSERTRQDIVDELSEQTNIAMWAEGQALLSAMEALNILKDELREFDRNQTIQTALEEVAGILKCKCDKNLIEQFRPIIERVVK